MISSHGKEFLQLFEPFATEESGRSQSQAVLSSYGSLAENIRAKKQSSAEYALVLSILSLALKDVGALHHGNRKNNARKRHWKDAADWFQAEPDDLHSFKWVASIIGFDPDIAVSCLKQRKCPTCSTPLLHDFCRCRWSKAPVVEDIDL